MSQILDPDMFAINQDRMTRDFKFFFLRLSYVFLIFYNELGEKISNNVIFYEALVWCLTHRRSSRELQSLTSCLGQHFLSYVTWDSLAWCTNIKNINNDEFLKTCTWNMYISIKSVTVGYYCSGQSLSRYLG